MAQKQKSSKTTTIQGRLSRSTSGEAVRALDAYAALFSRLERTYVRNIQAGNPPPKNEFMLTHQLTGRQFNALKRSAEGKIDSQRSNLPNYIIQYDAKISRLEEQVVKLRNKLQCAWRPEQLWRKIKLKTERIQRFRAKVDRVQAAIDTQRPSICYGSRRLFNAQHNLELNGFADHSAWREA